jgi:ubiquinone/menaquinone biosynthesis C-methylase UbiE
VSTPSAVAYASFYDFYDGPEYRGDQLAMYRRLAGEAGPRILELGCGTGIVTLDLARSGHCITGLDIDDDMLAVAARKLDAEPPDVRSRVRLVQADMKDFQLDRQFDMVFAASNTFGLLTSQADQKACLGAGFAHLRPGGLLVIEERDLTPDKLLSLLQHRSVLTVHMARINPATGLHTTFCWVTQNVDLVTQTITSRRWIDERQKDGSLKRYVPRQDGLHLSHYFNRFELQLLIEQAGFAVREIRGMTFLACKPDPHGACSPHNQSAVKERSTE